MNRWALLPVCAAVILAASFRGDGADRVTIHLKWLHGAQFAGLYAAEAHGIFAREGLEVELVDGPATDEVLVALSEGAYDFVVGDPSRHLSVVGRGIPNVAVAAVFQIDPVVIFALPESGIRRPEDLVGKRVMSFATGYVVPAILGRVGLSDDDIELGPPSFDLSELYSGAYDAWVGYYTNEVLQARADGYDVDIIYPTDYGVRLYGDVLIARKDLVETRPDLVRRVVSSLIEGWRWVFDHVEEAAGLALAWDPGLDLEKQRQVLAACLPFIHVGESHLGEMTSRRWSDVAAAMAAFGLLPTDFDVAVAYSLDLVRAPYPPGP